MHKLNCLGLPPFRNTNRAAPKYKRKLDRLARKAGFMNHAHRVMFLQLRRLAMHDALTKVSA